MIRLCALTILACAVVLANRAMHADQVVLSDGLPSDGHMTVRTDQYGAFGSFSVRDPGFGRFDPDGNIRLRDWQFWSGLMLADDTDFLWLMDEDDWPNDFGTRVPDSNLISDQDDGSTRTSSFVLPEFGDLAVELVQETPPSGYNFVQTYQFTNGGAEPLSLNLVWMDDVDMEFAQGALDNVVGFIEGSEPRVFFIEDSDIAGPGNPGIADRDRRVSVLARTSGEMAFDGYLVGRAPLGRGGATHLHFYVQRNLGIEDEFLNSVQEITRNSGLPAGILDEDGDNLLDDPGDTSGAMQFSLDLSANGSATLTLDFVGGSLSNSIFSTSPFLQAGDADQDLDFDQLDLVQVQITAKYLTGETASWGEGDWNGAPAGNQGNPPAGDGQFNQLDIISALGPGHYLMGPYAAIKPGGREDDEQTSLVYDTTTGELKVDSPKSKDLTSINITSAGGLFSGDKPIVLDGAFDNFANDNIFKATFGGSFGDVSFGNVLPPGLAEADIANDLSVVGSLDGGGELGDVDLVYVPEPSTVALLGMSLVIAITYCRLNAD